ncbi:isrso11-transposase orfb protein [Oceanobacter sp. RED65]|uniref:Isrso11-transposase orfb protein n=2 Tax=Bermanella marisrubri TaxID=207949 RepID=Q1MXX8_9GAMM|nr:isrso11-transposase orfb protein [Oceanobacter sp. RED65] [Bermanella marisrubri]EAT12899.1 isrso11-transposase orfb protein [Oceanobacter sp. RED65] [Bermanella marisrubri]
MRDMGLKSKIRVKKYRSYKGEIGRIAQNHLQRDFKASKPNEKWATDVTEFNVKGEKLYLSPVIDLYNGEIVSYQVAKRPTLPLVMNMLQKAYKRLSGQQAPLLHSDQGWQYQHVSYREKLAERGLTQSMSRKGNCLDNAAMESFFGTLKSEMYHLKRFESLEELERDIKSYIRYYNRYRIKLKLKGLSPVDYRNQTLNP